MEKTAKPENPVQNEPPSPEPAPSNEVISVLPVDSLESFAVSEKSDDAPLDPVSLWHDLTRELLKDRPSLGSFLSIASVAAVSEESIDIRFPATCSFQFAEASKKNNREFITEKIRALSKRPVELHMSIETERHSTENKTAAAAMELPPSLSDDIDQEPVIKTVMDMFDAEAI